MTETKWFKSAVGSTYFRFMEDGTKQVRFPAISKPGVSVAELIITVAA